MNSTRVLAIILTLILAAAAGYVSGGSHGAIFWFLASAAAITWKFI